MFSYNLAGNQMGFTEELFNNMFCGSIAGFGNCVSGFALDTIKTRVQLNRMTIMQCFRSIVKNEGFMALFNGIYYPLITVPLINAVSFGSYELYKSLDKDVGLSFLSGMEAGAFSGIVGSFVVNPVELVKIRMQAGQRRFHSSTECLKQILKTEGLRGIYKGMFSTIAREIPSMAGQFAAYEITKEALLRHKQRKVLSLWESILTGGVAGLGAWVFAYPQDIIKTHLQNNQQEFRRHRWIPDGGFVECAKCIYSSHGFKGFLVGVEACLLRAFIANAFMIVFYQEAQALLRVVYHPKP